MPHIGVAILKFTFHANIFDLTGIKIVAESIKVTVKVTARFCGGIEKTLPPNQLSSWPKSPPPNRYCQNALNRQKVTASFFGGINFRYC